MSVFNVNNIPKTTQPKRDKPLIMLIDDEIENLNVLHRLFNKDYQIITCLGGDEALETINNMTDPQTIQLIISDQRMPKMSGISFFESIIDKMPHTVRIILTGCSDRKAIIDAINKARLYKFITKPFNPAELSRLIQKGIQGHQRQ